MSQNLGFQNLAFIIVLALYIRGFISVSCLQVGGKTGVRLKLGEQEPEFVDNISNFIQKLVKVEKSPVNKRPISVSK